MSVQNFSFLARLEVAEKFVVGWPQNVTPKNGNGAQKNVHIFKSNAPTLLRSNVYQVLDFFLIQLCDVLME